MREVLQSGDSLLRQGEAIRSPRKGEGESAGRVDQPTCHTEPVKPESLELMVMFPDGQNEELEPLSEIVGELRDHEPGPVGGEAAAGERAGAETVLELLDVVLGAAAGEVVSDDARSCAPAVRNDGGVEELADHTLRAFVVGGSLDDHAEGPGPAHGSICDLRPLGPFLPGVAPPRPLGNALDRMAKGRGEPGRDGELEAPGEQCLDDLAAVKAGIHAQAHQPTLGKAAKAFAQEAYCTVRACSIAPAQTHTEQGAAAPPRSTAADGDP